MQIKINEKFEIFSQKNGSNFLILNTDFFASFYPGKVKFQNFFNDENHEICIKFEGPCDSFKVFQDLKSGNIKVYLKIKDEVLSYKIFSQENKIVIYFDRVFKSGAEIFFKETKRVFSKDKIFIPVEKTYIEKPKEILFFGLHKKQNIDDIFKRQNLLEIFPFIYLISQFYPDVKESQNLITSESKTNPMDKKDIYEKFSINFKSLFSFGFIPRTTDEEFQNILISNQINKNPIYILKSYAKDIRDLFFIGNDKKISILSLMPKDFFSGKFINIKTSFGSIDIEWSKNLLKKAIIKSDQNIDIYLELQKDVKGYRIKNNLKSKGSTNSRNDVLNLKKNTTYFLDRFFK